MVTEHIHWLLFAIAAFLLAYNGFSRADMVLSKLASVAALGVAMFPCECANPSELVLPAMGSPP